MDGPCKQLYDITLDDLRQFPIWEYLSEDNQNAQDECTVRGTRKPFSEVENICIVRACFILADGTKLPGYVIPGYELEHAQPLIFFEGGPMSFWEGIQQLTEKDVSERYAFMNRQREAVFPIKWASDVIITGCFSDGRTVPNIGSIEGFGYINSSGLTKYIK